MKRFTLVVAAMFAVSLSFGAISCDKYDDGRPDKSVRNEFSQMYPDARDVEWEAEAGYWKVSFETGKAPNRIDHEAWYAEDGTWVRTVSEYPLSKVPQGIRDLLAGSEYGTLPLENNEVEYFETSSYGKFYRFDLWQNGREIKVDVHESGEVVPASYDVM